jgi:RimJ/RimL family protein N-acetyltransferase
MKTPIIRTKTFILRPPLMGDAEDFVALLNDKKVSRYMTQIPYPYTLSSALPWLKKEQSAFKLKNRPSYHFVIEQDGRAVGLVGLKEIKAGHRADFGYWLGKAYWGQGIMSSAVKLVTDFGFQKLKLRRIQAYVFKPNVASKKVLEKNGFKTEGLLRKDIRKDGHLFDVYILAKVK